MGLLEGSAEGKLLSTPLGGGVEGGRDGGRGCGPAAVNDQQVVLYQDQEFIHNMNGNI